MNERILLDQPQTLPGQLLVATTKRCFLDISNADRDPEETLCALSAHKTLLFWGQSRGERTVYQLYTREGVYSTAESDDGTLLLTSYRTATLRDNNTCLKAGIPVQPDGGVTVSIHVVLDETSQCIRVFHEGETESSTPTAGNANLALFPLLDRLFLESHQNNRHSRDTNEPYKLPEEAERLLSIAEGYTRTDADLERARAQQVPPMVFWDFHPAQAYDRQDRVAYTAFVAPYDEEKYGVNGKVQLEAMDGTLLGATILDLGTENGENTVTLLFDDQLSFSALPATGQIRPSYSDIQNEVRQDVIDDLRKGESAAGFLADVLGNFEPGGFIQKDLRTLDNALVQKKYPPNASQVDAIHRGIEAENILLVLGPPGTGKTTVILEWVKYFIRQEGKRVLISSQNNKAVDNVLERLTQEKGISAIRAGNEAKVQASMHPYLLENKLKGLRENVERSMTGNLAALRELDGQYDAYYKNVLLAQEEAQRRDQARSDLEQTAQKRYGPLRQRLIQGQKSQTQMHNRLAALVRRVRLYEFFMVDPIRHPILRWLLTPLRMLLHRPMHRALAEYAELYRKYQQNLETGRQEYAALCAMTGDGQLIRLAQILIQWTEAANEKAELLHTPPDDRLIWRKEPWPEIPANGTLQAMEAYRQAVKSRRARLPVLESACQEWEEHVRSRSNYALSDLLLESADLVGATCIGINSQRKFSRLDFDVTIIDEAGQIQIHNALVPISRSPKLIMLGDHQQIPPIADEEQAALCEEQGIDTTFLSTSLFEYLYDHLPPSHKAFLDTQYRMPAQIADLLGEWFYEGRYKSFAGKRNMPSLCPALFASPFVVVSTSDGGSARFEYKPELGAGNHYEAGLVAAIVKALLEGRFGEPLTPADLGVISPYGEQVQNIQKRLRKVLPSLSAIEVRDMVASLDSFQGQERKVILYSCTRSNQKPAARSRIGFLKELRRLNVALSRPLQQLVFVGDIDFLASCTNGEGRGSEAEFSAFIRLMRRYACEQGEFVLSKEFMRRLETE